MFRSITSALCTLSLTIFAGAATAVDSASGTLKMISQDKPVSIEINHVYYITGPDSFAPAQTTRRLIFSTDDARAAIDACETESCAMSAFGNGIRVELESDTSMARWWAHVKPTQQSGMTSASIVSLSTDTPERVAGTLTINSLGVDAKITFDASLVNAFDQ